MVRECGGTEWAGAPVVHDGFAFAFVTVRFCALLQHDVVSHFKHVASHGSVRLEAIERHLHARHMLLSCT